MWTRVKALILKEFLAIWKDPKSRTLIFVPPLIQLLIFANCITMEMRNINLVALDNSQTYESRALMSRFEHSKWFKKVTYVKNEKVLRYYIQTQRAQMGVMIDNHFANQIKAKKQAIVQVVTDGRQTNSAAISGSYAAQIINQYSEEISPKDGAAINVIIRNWFNPNLEYQWFLLVSLITILALVVTLILTALSIARERELGTFDQLIVSPLSSVEILIGKTIPPLFISICLTCAMTAIVITFFKIPFVGSFILFLFSTFISLLAIVGIGLFISALCNTQQQAILGAFIFQMPAVLLSGFTSPVEDMPLILQYIDFLNPIRFFMVTWVFMMSF
jgi:ABC-2 type transport system permease protein